MNARPEIPGHEHRISFVELVGDALVVRLAPDSHPDAEASAYRISIKRADEPEAARSFLERLCTNEEFVYVFWKDDLLVFAAEHGEEFFVSGEGFEGVAVELSQAELRYALKRVYAWYLAENESARNLRSKLQTARELMADQANRTRVKAASHATDSTVGVLYTQQLNFLERLARETEV